MKIKYLKDAEVKAIVYMWSKEEISFSSFVELFNEIIDKKIGKYDTTKQKQNKSITTS